MVVGDQMIKEITEINISADDDLLKELRKKKFKEIYFEKNR